MTHQEIIIELASENLTLKKKLDVQVADSRRNWKWYSETKDLLDKKEIELNDLKTKK